MKSSLTQSEKNAFEYIKAQLMEGLSPTMREIASALMYSNAFFSDWVRDDFIDICIIVYKYCILTCIKNQTSVYCA
jgi:hypothetical protein